MASVESLARALVRRFCSRDCGDRGSGDWRVGVDKKRGSPKDDEAAAFCLRLNDML